MLLYGLLGVSLLGLLLPRRWTGGLMSLVQVIVPFQHAANVATDQLSDLAPGDAAPVPRSAVQILERERDALEHQVAALSTRVLELEEEVGVLSATRLWGGEGGRLGGRGRLIPARVVAPDMLPWRSSRLVNAGSLQGVRRGAAVASRYFSISRGEADGLRPGLAILLAETLVGDIVETGTHTAHVRLVSDVGVEMKVRLARRTDAGFEPLDRFFWLMGRGGGVMEIRDVERREVEAGGIRIGDLVLSDHTSANLPASMVIGKVVAIDSDRHNPLLSVLTVKAAVDPASLRRVFVYDAATSQEG